MPKKKSSKAPAQNHESPVVEQVKPNSKLKKLGNEIDEIFSGKKRKKSEEKKNYKAIENEAGKPILTKKKKQRKSIEDKEGRFTDPPVRPQKKSQDGFTIYTEEELGINKANAGGTPLCPFDCDCCF